MWRIKLYLTITFFLLVVFYTRNNRKLSNELSRHDNIRSMSTWKPTHNIRKFDRCDVPCFFDTHVPLVGRKVVFDEYGRSTTFMHTMEGPHHYPRSTTKGKYDALSSVSMDSDVPLPYFSWAEYNIQSTPLDYYSAIKGAVFIAKNCKSLNGRENIIREMQKEMRIDSLSSCLNNAKWPDDIPRSNKNRVLKRYLFYFAFENECSVDYMTEKLWGALESGSLPIYYGAPNVLDYVPPSSIIDINKYRDETGVIDFKSLANYLKYLSNNKDEYMKYHKWRYKPLPQFFHNNYDFTHDHGICRSCRYNLARHEPLKYKFDHKSQQLLLI